MKLQLYINSKIYRTSKWYHRAKKEYNEIGNKSMTLKLGIACVWYIEDKIVMVTFHLNIFTLITTCSEYKRQEPSSPHLVLVQWWWRKFYDNIEKPSQLWSSHWRNYIRWRLCVRDASLCILFLFVDVLANMKQIITTKELIVYTYSMVGPILLWFIWYALIENRQNLFLFQLIEADIIVQIVHSLQTRVC